jgi:hypothetical protein
MNFNNTAERNVGGLAVTHRVECDRSHTGLASPCNTARPLAVGDLVIGVTRSDFGAVRVEGVVIEARGSDDLVILRPTERAQREVGLTDQGIGYGFGQIERAQ